MKLILDGEWTVPENPDGTLQRKDNGKLVYGSPYDPNNKLVSVQYKIVETGEKGCLFFHHKEKEVPASSNTKYLQRLLDEADLAIGHNLKADFSWLYECGFKYDGAFYDTMIFEYISGKGLKIRTSLAECALRYNLEAKKDILEGYFAKDVNTDRVPMVELEEYGMGDIETTHQLYEHQRNRYKNDSEIRTMWPVIKLTNEALEVLIDIERAGIKIDREALENVEDEFRKEQQDLQIKLTDMARDVIGDTPVNFASPADMSKLVYSIELKDKKEWKELFNIGTEIRNAVKKPKYNKRYREKEFRDIIKQQSVKVQRTDAVHCEACDGKGKFYKTKKDGSSFKKETTCKDCEGDKVIYKPSGSVGGFKVKPISYEYATTNGFSTDKTTINDLIELGELTEDAELFLTGLQRLNALDTYLTSFVGGIRSGIRLDGLCHPNFNQCVTATGRLSSSGPNFQNFPRANTFPIRKVFVSRWADIGGTLYDIDFAALEYRVAVMLANCQPGLTSILLNKDRHEMSAEYLYDAIKAEMEEDEFNNVRQKAKPGTFQPLYGGVGQTDRSRAYAVAFFEEHTGIAKWQDELCSEAITYKQIVCPDGQIFAFPFAERKGADRVVSKTQIVNYPVQHFATFTIVWAVLVDLYRAMKAAKVKSKLVLQVHDSVTCDVHPEEKQIMKDLTIASFSRTLELLKIRFNYETNVPIGFEVSEGNNLMEKKKIYKG